ncbi:MAG: hypothetical protein MZW92_20390 [Comamonadaceae bacterium]|nr:hypothetical protein [Comamonadaceae bacterium]
MAASHASPPRSQRGMIATALQRVNEHCLACCLHRQRRPQSRRHRGACPAAKSRSNEDDQDADDARDARPGRAQRGPDGFRPGRQPPRPPKELAQLKAFQGAWLCHGNVPAGPYGPARKTATTIKIDGDLDGMWFRGASVTCRPRATRTPSRAWCTWATTPSRRTT